MGKESGLAKIHRASRGGSARPQCPDGTLSAPPPLSPLLGLLESGVQPGRPRQAGSGSSAADPAVAKWPPSLL